MIIDLNMIFLIGTQSKYFMETKKNEISLNPVLNTNTDYTPNKHRIYLLQYPE